MNACDVVIVAYRSRPQVEALLRHLPEETSILLVDNSTREEELADLLVRFPAGRHIDAGGNIGFSAAANLGAESATAPYLVFLNPDVRPDPGALNELVNTLVENPEIASVGAAGVESSGGGAHPSFPRILAHSIGLHRLFPNSGVFLRPGPDEVMDVDWVSGSCLAIRSEAFWKVGGFDSRYFVYMSDFDLGDRLRREGFRQVLRGDVIVHHEDGGSSYAVAPFKLWEQRGRAWVRFVRSTRRSLPAATILGTLAAGYAARAVFHRLMGQLERSREMVTYLRAMREELSER